MRAHFTNFVDRDFPVPKARKVSVAVIGSMLVATLAITTGAMLAAEDDSDGAAGHTTIDARQREQQEALSAEIKANLKAFDRMEQAPMLFTHRWDVTAAAASVEIEANLDTFDRMEQAPGLFRKIPIESQLTHPWGGDALTPDY